MIEVLDKGRCCGCESCVQICPKHCITFNEDECGFRYPSVNKDECINCSLCERVCPVLDQNQPKLPLMVYAAQNPDDKVRLCSSSGGIFTSIAAYVIEQGGLVFGAAFDTDFNVCHICAASKEDLKKLRGSKYVQSRIGDVYLRVRNEVKEGRLVLFSGTPCQIAGLNRYLGKEYDNLIRIDIVCHGVPSPAVWRSYLDDIKSHAGDEPVGAVSFRDKSTGWTDYSFVVRSENENVIVKESHRTNLFMRLFLTNLSIRPSCFECPAKKGKSGSDITLGDYWGVDKLYPKFHDDLGVSLILINTLKGGNILNLTDILIHEAKYEDVVCYNPCIERSTPYNRHYDSFWASYESNKLGSVDSVLNKCRPNLLKRIFNKLKAIFNKLFHV